MKIRDLILLQILMISICNAQVTPNANLIKVKGVTLSQVGNALLDVGFNIEKKDTELGLIKTEMKKYDKHYNAAYFLQIRVKDSIGTIKGFFTAPWEDPFTPNFKKTEPFWKDEPIIYRVNRKGNFQDQSMNGYPFIKMIELAQSLNGEIEYIKE